MNTKSKKTKTRAEELKKDDIARTTIDLTTKEKADFGNLNDNYVYTRKGYLKPFIEATLRNLANHKDKKRIMKEIFNRV